MQWLALFLLFGGVSVVQMQPTHSDAGSSSSSTTSGATAVQSRTVGFCAVLASSLCSGFAGKIIGNLPLALCHTYDTESLTH